LFALVLRNADKSTVRPFPTRFSINLNYGIQIPLQPNVESVNTDGVLTLQDISTHYGTDIDTPRLHLHSAMLGDLCCSAEPPITVTDGVADVVQMFTENISWVGYSCCQKSSTCYDYTAVMSCRAERSFSSLRRLKQTFLRSTVTQKRLNHIAVLHSRREEHAALEEICSSSILKNQTRQSAFAMFPK